MRSAAAKTFQRADLPTALQPSAGRFQRLAGYLALLIVLCLPLAQRLHLLADHTGHAHAVVAIETAAVDDHALPEVPNHRHSLPVDPHRDCAECLSFAQLTGDLPTFDLFAILLGETPAVFVVPDYLAPTVASVDTTVAIPRGPPTV